MRCCCLESRRALHRTPAAVPAPPTTPPKGIPITVPLKKAPPKGKTAGYVVCNLPTCSLFMPGYKAAAAALGWNAKFFVYTGTDPQPAMLQAIQAHVNYISITGASVAQFKTALAAAKKLQHPRDRAVRHRPGQTQGRSVRRLGRCLDIRQLHQGHGPVDSQGRWREGEHGLRQHPRFPNSRDRRETGPREPGSNLLRVLVRHSRGNGQRSRKRRRTCKGGCLSANPFHGQLRRGLVWRSDDRPTGNSEDGGVRG